MRVALTLLLLVVATAGCSDTGSPEPKASATAPAKQKKKEPTKPALKRDLAWLARLHKWEMKLGRDSVKVTSTIRAVKRGEKTNRALRRALRPFIACPQTLRTKVGEPRPPGYSGSYALLERSCEITRKWALDVTANPSARGALRKELRRAEDLFFLADGDLQTSLRAYKDLPMIGGKVSRSRIEPRLTRAVSSFVYRSPPDSTGVAVRCWSRREWPLVKKELRAYTGHPDFEGFAYGETQISISPRICAALVKLMYGNSRPSSGRDLFWASASVGVLSHEAQHLLDSGGSEAETECLGMQNMRAVGRLLRTSGSYADFLANTYWTHIYRLNSAEYRTSACYDGGPLDRQPAGGVWP